MLNELLHSTRCWSFIVLIFFTPVSSFAALYNVLDRMIGGQFEGYTLNGFIETDGTLGPLAANNITDFQIGTFQDGSGPLETLVSQPTGDHFVTIIGNGLVASPTDLSFTFARGSGNFVRFESQFSPNFWNLVQSEEQVRLGIQRIDIRSGTQVIASAPVPAPSAILLFGTGLIGFVGWRWWNGKGR